MSVEITTYSQDNSADGFGPDPIVTMTVRGTFDVSRLLNLLNGAGARCEDLDRAEELAAKLRRHAGGRAALQTLKAHGGPDFTNADAEQDQVAGIADIPPWARPEVRFTISCLYCEKQHTTDEDGNPDLFPADALTDPGAYFDGEWFVHEGKPCCSNCWEAAFCEGCSRPIHAWEQAAIDPDRECTAHPSCLTAEELAVSTVMPALEAAKVLHEAWAERNAAKNAELEQAGGESR